MANLEISDETAERVLGHGPGGVMACRDSADRWRGAYRRQYRSAAASFTAFRGKFFVAVGLTGKFMVPRGGRVLER
jgi:hypothetical protein